MGWVWDVETKKECRDVVARVRVCVKERQEAKRNRVPRLAWLAQGIRYCTVILWEETKNKTREEL